MARRKGKLRDNRVIVLYSNEEFQEVKKLFARSINKTISGYVRKVSLEEPIGIINRNASFDSFVEEIVQLRREMSLVRHLTLSPENESLIVRLHQEIKLLITKIAELCMPR
jgi:hypothetical protein